LNVEVVGCAGITSFQMMAGPSAVTIPLFRRRFHRNLERVLAMRMAQMASAIWRRRAQATPTRTHISVLSIGSGAVEEEGVGIAGMITELTMVGRVERRKNEGK
jgi:hypothetical protein